MLGALVQVTVSGTEVKIYIKPTPSGLFFFLLHSRTSGEALSVIEV